MQNILVYILFAAAVLYLAYFVFNKYLKKQKSNCSTGGCDKC
jgi:hypothetical protein